jgi:hypothetical protein
MLNQTDRAEHSTIIHPEGLHPDSRGSLVEPGMTSPTESIEFF